MILMVDSVETLSESAQVGKLRQNTVWNYLVQLKGEKHPVYVHES